MQNITQLPNQSITAYLDNWDDDKAPKRSLVPKAHIVIKG